MVTSTDIPVIEACPVPGDAKASCAHCGATVPAGKVDPGAPLQFCCGGCRSAYEVIHAAGLDRFYHVRDESAREATPAKGKAKSYAEFDDPLFSSLYVKTDPATGYSRAELFLEGMHCAGCAWLVERLPRAQPGVIESRVDRERHLVALTWDPRAVTLSQVARTLDSLGYPPHPARDVAARARRKIEDRRTLVRLGVAGACAGNLMLLGAALYAGLFDTMSAEHQKLLRWASMLISLVAVAWPGSVFFKGAWAALRTRAPNLDLPIAISLLTGSVWGVVNTILGRGEIYFDSLSALVFALLIGRAVQQRQQRAAVDSVELLFSLTPSSARIVREGVPVEAPIEAVKAGDLVEVLAEETIPADGVVESGRSSVNESLLTGESAPVGVDVGSEVHAGATNLAAPIRVRVRSTGEATRVGRLMRMVEEGMRRRAPIVRLADAISIWFVRAMLVLGAGTGIAWWFIDPSRAVDNAAAVLLVVCPCAVGLATPLAVTVAIGRAARRGILIKGGDALQALAGKGVVYLDKTGTITQGKTALVRWVGDDAARPLVAALERTSSHPVARALVRDLADVTSGDPRVEDVEQVTGLGVTGLVEGQRVAVGSSRFVRGPGARHPEALRAEEDEILRAGLSPVVVAVDGEIVAIAGVGDPIRPDAAGAIRALEQAGWEVRILSGDHPRVVEAVARTLGVPGVRARGGVAPEEKLAAITEASRSGTVVMVGDGVNDAAALAAATVGIAVHGGAEASMSAADVYLSTPGLAPVVDLFESSRRTMGIIHTSLGVSIFYNLVSTTLAVTGLITPLVAALFMPVSSLTVLALSVRRRSFQPARESAPARVVPVATGACCGSCSRRVDTPRPRAQGPSCCGKEASCR